MERLLLSAVIFLSGCASHVDYTPLYLCPHPVDQVAKAESFVEKIEYLPPEEMAEACEGAGSTVGCTIEYSIYINDRLSRADKADTRFHELCHFYELDVLGLPLQSSKNHAGWLRTPALF